MFFFFFFDEPGSKDVANLLPQLVDDSLNEEMPRSYTKYLRIHGDNIVECERTLEIIKEAYKGKLTLLKSPLYKPKYLLTFSDGAFVIELLSGHDRWGVDVVAIIQNQGGILHEGADSYVTELNGNVETVLFELEYCSALPAGNNAWQRSGRALSAALAGVPYLYYTELGGVELDEDRNVKAPRFPNPVVPFSYVSTSKRYRCCCVPVYKTHPAITQQLFAHYQNALGEEQGREIIKGIINKEDYSASLTTLINKDLALVKLLANGRRTTDTLRGVQWDQLLSSDKPDEWLANNTATLIWQKKSADKVLVSNTFKQLIASVIGYSCRTIGGRDLPICIVPINKIPTLETKIHALYPNLNISLDRTKPLAIVWITGFKPRGDDSRPDRGLVPLARMTLGGQANMMCVVSGPAKRSTWNKLNVSLNELCADNGLWLAVFNLCNYVLIDSATIAQPKFFNNSINIQRSITPVTFTKAGNPSAFTEDDTDCAIHQIFAHKNNLGILEGMCNPPGGDWSGISCVDKKGEYRWTSLPRVSQIGGKRPDHVIQIALQSCNVFFSIESKGAGRDLENGIGTKLTDYLRDLFSTLPTAQRKVGTEWRSMGNDLPVLDPYRIVSIGAFMYSNASELEVHRVRGHLDAILAFQLGQTSTVHVVDRTNDKIVEKVLKQAEQAMTGFVIQVH